MELYRNSVSSLQSDFGPAKKLVVTKVLIIAAIRFRDHLVWPFAGGRWKDKDIPQVE